MELREAVEVFFSYSHEDEKLKDELVKHLSLLRRDKVIAAWHDRKIGAGHEWAKEIDSHLESARIILLLVSSDFLNSDYCMDNEVARAMERHDRGEARVIPIILRHIDDWNRAIFARLKVLPRDGKPVKSWPDRDEAFADVAAGIREAVDELLAERVNPLVQKLKRAESLRNWPNVVNIGARILSVCPNHGLVRKIVARALIAQWYRKLDLRHSMSCFSPFGGDLRIFLQQGDRAELVADVSKAIELDPRNADYYFFRSCVADHEEKNIEDLTRAIELSPQDAKHHYARGLQFKSRDKEAAERDFRRVLELGFQRTKQPEQPAVWTPDSDLLKSFPTLYLPQTIEITRDGVEGSELEIGTVKLKEHVKADLAKIWGPKP